MKFSYHGYEIDSTPAFSVGRFFAKATITCPQSNGETTRNVVQIGDCEQFNDALSAESFGRNQAIEWVNARIYEKSNEPH
ncbi:hypothetical protein [Paraburkholderia flava]|uniref:hypothetical protein n=1 Tax=Paraburkholderia flava TaxID=2547393 RepID=UPI00105CBAF2|nr:hypothetical protein [Paraburkholderia flava]